MSDRWERRDRKRQADRERIAKHGQMTPILNAIRNAAKRAKRTPRKHATVEPPANRS